MAARFFNELPMKDGIISHTIIEIGCFLTNDENRSPRLLLAKPGENKARNTKGQIPALIKIMHLCSCVAAIHHNAVTEDSYNSSRYRLLYNVHLYKSCTFFI